MTMAVLTTPKQRIATKIGVNAFGRLTNANKSLAKKIGVNMLQTLSDPCYFQPTVTGT